MSQPLNEERGVMHFSSHFVQIGFKRGVGEDRDTLALKAPFSFNNKIKTDSCNGHITFMLYTSCHVPTKYCKFAS